MIIMFVLQPQRFTPSGGGASNARVTPEGDTRITSEGDTRVQADG